MQLGAGRAAGPEAAGGVLGLRKPCPLGWAGCSLFGLGRGRMRDAKETSRCASLLLPGSSLVPQENARAGSARLAETSVTQTVSASAGGVSCSVQTGIFFFFPIS